MPKSKSLKYYVGNAEVLLAFYELCQEIDPDQYCEKHPVVAAALFKMVKQEKKTLKSFLELLPRERLASEHFGADVACFRAAMTQPPFVEAPVTTKEKDGPKKKKPKKKAKKKAFKKSKTGTQLEKAFGSREKALEAIKAKLATGSQADVARWLNKKGVKAITPKNICTYLKSWRITRPFRDKAGVVTSAAKSTKKTIKQDGGVIKTSAADQILDEQMRALCSKSSFFNQFYMVMSLDAEKVKAKLEQAVKNGNTIQEASAWLSSFLKEKGITSDKMTKAPLATFRQWAEMAEVDLSKFEDKKPKDEITAAALQEDWPTRVDQLPGKLRGKTQFRTLVREVNNEIKAAKLILEAFKGGVESKEAANKLNGEWGLNISPTAYANMYKLLCEANKSLTAVESKTGKKSKTVQLIEDVEKHFGSKEAAAKAVQARWNKEAKRRLHGAITRTRKWLANTTGLQINVTSMEVIFAHFKIDRSEKALMSKLDRQLARAFSSLDKAKAEIKRELISLYDKEVKDPLNNLVVYLRAAPRNVFEVNRDNISTVLQARGLHPTTLGLQSVGAAATDVSELKSQLEKAFKNHYVTLKQVDGLTVLATELGVGNTKALFEAILVKCGRNRQRAADFLVKRGILPKAGPGGINFSNLQTRISSVATV